MVRCFTLVLSALLLAGCGGPGPSGDEGKTPAEIQAAIKDIDKPAIESVIAKYESAISDKSKELEALQAKIAEAAKGAVGDLLGGDKADGAKADLDAVKADAEKIAEALTSLRDRLAIYVQELSTRT